MCEMRNLVDPQIPIDTIGRYNIGRVQKKNVTISVEIHQAVKAYAFVRQMKLEAAMHKLLKIGLLSELENEQ